MPFETTATAQFTPLWVDEKNRKPNEIEARDDRTYQAELARQRKAKMTALASLDAADGGIPMQSFEQDHLRHLPQQHPARDAESASQPEEHQVAKSFHERRTAALDPTGNAGSAASHAHKDAALAHEKASKSGESGDSAAARQASSKANGLEYIENGQIGS